MTYYKNIALLFIDYLFTFSMTIMIDGNRSKVAEVRSVVRRQRRDSFVIFVTLD